MLFACAATAFAQPAEGDMMVKGSIGLNVLGTMPSDNNTLGGNYSTAINSISVSPSFEYFLSDRFSIGGTVQFGADWMRVKDDMGYVGRSGTNEFNIGFNANYYFRMTENLYLSLNGFLGYSNTTYRDMVKSESNKQVIKSCGNMAVLSITPTLNYFINDKWVLTASIGNVAAAIGSMPESDMSIISGTSYYLNADFGTIALGVGYKF